MSNLCNVVFLLLRWVIGVAASIVIALPEGFQSLTNGAN